MFEFKPEFSDGIVTYTAVEDGIVSGNCSVKISGIYAILLSVECEDVLLQEGLLRSALNFAANRGAFVADIPADKLCPGAERLGFTANKTEREIPDVLTGSCCSCKK